MSLPCMSHDKKRVIVPLLHPISFVDYESQVNHPLLIYLIILGSTMISMNMKYSFNNRQRQRVPSIDSSTSEDTDPYGPASNEYIFNEENHGSKVTIV